jgi:hypothetical protein
MRFESEPKNVKEHAQEEPRTGKSENAENKDAKRKSTRTQPRQASREREGLNADENHEEQSGVRH